MFDEIVLSLVFSVIANARFTKFEPAGKYGHDWKTLLPKLVGVRLYELCSITAIAVNSQKSFQFGVPNHLKCVTGRSWLDVDWVPVMKAMGARAYLSPVIAHISRQGRIVLTKVRWSSAIFAHHGPQVLRTTLFVDLISQAAGA